MVGLVNKQVGCAFGASWAETSSHKTCRRAQSRTKSLLHFQFCTLFFMCNSHSFALLMWSVNAVASSAVVVLNVN